MRLSDLILESSNMEKAIRKVVSNRGSAGIDDMPVDEIRAWMEVNGDELAEQIREMKYKPSPVRRVYIPKPNGKKRPLGIPTVVDRVVQQATYQILYPIFDSTFSDSSFGFREGRSAHQAIERTLEYLNEGYEWVVDLDIEKFFDMVNHDKLISIIRLKVNEKETLHLIRSFLKAGVMEEGKLNRNDLGTPQGGNISPLLANIYLDVFDKELENRGLRFVRYADDVTIYCRSEMAANRVMRSVSSWLERKLFLKVSPTKTHVVRPPESTFLGFTFWKGRDGWKCKPANDRKQRLYKNMKELLCRRKAAAMPLSYLFTKVNQKVRGWINYFSIGSMKRFLIEFGQWLRHKIRVVVFKQWKRPKTLFKNLMILNKQFKTGFSKEEIRQTANSRLGLWRTTGWRTVNFILSPKVLALPNKEKERPGLIDPVGCYLNLQNKS